MAKKHNEPMDLAVGPVFLSDITVKEAQNPLFCPVLLITDCFLLGFPVGVEGGCEKKKRRRKETSKRPKKNIHD